MNQFEYVMVLVSIIIGLGITHVLFGISGVVDRRSRGKVHLELSIAHAAGLCFCCAWMVMFWWWEYRFVSRVTDWTVGPYLFLVIYSIALFLMSAILVPRNWRGAHSLKEYFLERRACFYSLLLLATILDYIDAYLKGGLGYIVDEQEIFYLDILACQHPGRYCWHQICQTPGSQFHGYLFLVCPKTPGV